MCILRDVVEKNYKITEWQNKQSAAVVELIHFRNEGTEEKKEENCRTPKRINDLKQKKENKDGMNEGWESEMLNSSAKQVAAERHWTY